MATQVWKNAYFYAGSVDLSAYVKSLTVNEGSETGDDTAMGDSTRSAMAGLLTYSIDVEFHQDFAAGTVDATLRALVGAAADTVTWRPDSGAIGADNPQRDCEMILASYVPASGSVGTVPLGATAKFVAAGDVEITTSA
ncbi:MAG: hypothetical protein PHE55_05190 [Methylococcaceae bacterium]|nr:hypothetical protein [Methylococcaceae bacterium]